MIYNLIYEKNSDSKIIPILLITLFIGSIIWSIIFETILPLVRAGAIAELVLNIVGIPVILIGTWIFVRGGYIFIKETFAAMSTEEINDNVEIIRAKSNQEASRQARRQNLNMLWQAWKPGLKLLAWGGFLIAIGGMGINLLKILGQDQIF